MLRNNFFSGMIISKSTNVNRKVLRLMEIHVGEIVTMKKPHPCGSKEWEVLREGADFRLKCCGCTHQIMISRRLLEKNIREKR